MNAQWMTWLGIVLAALAILVAGWDTWLTLMVNANVKKGLQLQEARPSKARPKAAAEALPPVPAPVLRVRANVGRGLPRTGPRVATGQPRASPATLAAAPTPCPWVYSPRPFGYPPSQYRDIRPDRGEGHKLLKMGMNQVRAGNPGLALSFLCPSLEIFSHGVGTQGEAREAWRGIQTALEVNPALHQGRGGQAAPAPKAGLHTF